MHLYLAPIVMLLGLLLYFLKPNPQMQEIGRIMFGFGLLVTLFLYARM